MCVSLRAAAGGLIFLLGLTLPAGAQALSNLLSFNQANGKDPRGGLVAGNDGFFYGTTSQGGTANAGTVFRLDPQTGGLSTLVHFRGANGRSPESALVDGNDGFFYGTTAEGGQHNRGTVFRVAPGGDFSTVAHFDADDGRRPGALILGSDGDLYGVTAGDFGTVFKVTPNDRVVTLVRFTRVNGEYPETLMQSSVDGHFYGTTRWGGAAGFGTVFRMEVSGDAGQLTVLNSFDGANGRTPHGDLLEDGEGNLFGTTIYGGSLGPSPRGNVYRITPEGTLVSLAEFRSSDGRYPTAGLILGRDGNFYGTTSEGGTGNAGTVFRCTPDGHIGNVAVFTRPVGSSPDGKLLQDSAGNLYGVTRLGGASGAGAVFKVNLSRFFDEPVPVIDSELAASGTVGTAFSYTITASGSPTSFGAAGLPVGLVVDDSTGEISGTPLLAGTFTITLSATNAVGTASADLTIIIAPDSVTRLRMVPAKRKATVGKKVKMVLVVSNDAVKAAPVTVRLLLADKELPEMIAFEAKPKKKPRQKAKVTRKKFEFVIPEGTPAGRTTLTAELVGMADPAKSRARSVLTVRLPKKL
jgi:uncharacterized repeat protein (TIGR03803 family)